MYRKISAGIRLIHRFYINFYAQKGPLEPGLAGYLLYPIPTYTPEGLPVQTPLFLAFYVLKIRLLEVRQISGFGIILPVVCEVYGTA